MLPYVVLHMGVSVDGRYDYGAGGEGPYYALLQYIRADSDLSGSGTILAAQMSAQPEVDMPELYQTWINKPDRQMLTVVDSQGKVKNWETICKQPFWRGFACLCSQATPEAHLEYLHSLGVNTITAGEDKVNLRAGLEELGERFGVRVVRVDSGGILNGVLLRAGLVAEVNVVINPCLVGGISPKTMFAAPDLESAAGIVHLKLEHVERMNEDYVWLKYKVKV